MFNLLKTDSRKVLFQFVLNFFLVNTLLALLSGVNYLSVLPPFQILADSTLAGLFIWCFLIISFIAQLVILFFVCFLFVNLVTALIPNRYITFALSMILSSILVFCLIADDIVFDMYHMHYAAVGIEIMKVHALPQVISLSLAEMFYILLVILALFLMEGVFAWLVWKNVTRYKTQRWNYRLASILVICVMTSYSLNLLARTASEKYGLSTNNNYLMVKATRFIPYYDEVYQLIMPVDVESRQIQTSDGLINLEVQQSNRILDYPKHSLSYQKQLEPLNIVVIAIDTWRYDTMNSKVAPNIYQFAQKSLQFQNHWSGGNCTKAGLFSLFYGVPENYWQAMLNQKRGPELIHQLIKSNYSMSVFASAQLNFPAFDQTIFREVKRLAISTPGNTTIARDKEITQEFKQFIATRNPKQPFFSFIFYDAAHNYCEPTIPNQQPFHPWQKNCNRLGLTIKSDPEPYLNRYRNAVYFVDSEVKQVLATLEQKHLMKNTIVIITADHGEEINDKHSGYWQHASAYTSYQLHTPFIVYWPGVKPKVYKHFTTHYDFAPTLMTEVLKCKNPPEDYSIGRSIFTVGHRPLLISGSYADYAILTKDQIVRIYRGGDFGMDDKNGQPIEKFSLKIPPLRQAYTYLTSYFKTG